MKRGTALRSCVVAAVALGLGPDRAARPSLASEVKVSVQHGGPAEVRTPAAEFIVGSAGCVEARLLAEGGVLSLDEVRDPTDCASSVTVGGREGSGIVLDFDRAIVADIHTDAGGPGRRVEIPGRTASGGLSDVETTLTFEARDAFPNAIRSRLTYRNVGGTAITLDRLVVPERRLTASRVDPGSARHALWSFHGSAERVGRDEVVALAPGFARSNALGAPGPRGVGGGIPVVAFWSASVGTALGHMEPDAVALSIPVEVSADGLVHATVRMEPHARLEPGQSFETPRLFHAVFSGDYYEALGIHSRLLEAQGQPSHSPSADSYEPSWCSWGYGEDVTPARMLGVLPKLVDLGIRWATVDDRWFDAYGDWRPSAETFPGDALRRVIDAYHARGVKLQIWWVPLAVETGAVLPRGSHHRTADVGLAHPEWLVLDETGRPARTTRGLSVFCPALPEVRRYHRQLVERFIGEWGFDGHKLDAVFTVPRCHNSGHHHRSPDDSLAALGTVYEEILSATRALKPDAVVQICSCGTAPHHAWLPFLTQAVAADPWGSAQRRQRIKMYKALLGPTAAVSGDHVELAEGPSLRGGEPARGRDFASALGLGGVVSTRFVWPEAPAGAEDVLLTPEKEKLWRKWLTLYQETRLSEGTFRNLYVHGFDRPEAYCVEKGGRMYYAFFTTDPTEVFEGQLELRGLEPRRHGVRDYVSGQSLGVVEGPRGQLRARFKEHLLLVATPEG